ncbi:uncharacterized protein VNE69_04015 [Vairimorpha necatrix]|uniref:Uncharacterized protein n=1 Tax=Vairimorpha necatrix TaxID=6039 RepID=A0AAX4JB51_9MICR
MTSKKNKNLTKKNTELLHEINKINELHTDIVKENIKKDYQTGRVFNKILEDLDVQIRDISSLLENTKNIKDKFIKESNIKYISSPLKEKDTNVPSKRKPIRYLKKKNK